MTNPIEKLKAALEKMTALPWVYREKEQSIDAAYGRDIVAGESGTPYGTVETDDAEGICELRNAAPWLLEYVERAEALFRVAGPLGDSSRHDPRIDHLLVNLEMRRMELRNFRRQHGWDDA